MGTTAPGASPDLNVGLAGALERTGAADLLDMLGEISLSDRRHCERVGQMTMFVAAQAGCQPDTAIRAGFAGSMHDVGKVDPSVQELITSAAPLTAVERIQVNYRHTSYGALLISAIGFEGEDGESVREAVKAARYHHHPARDLITLPEPTPITRMVQVADRFDAMQDGSRPYRDEPMTALRAAALIEEDLRGAGAWDRVTGTTLELLHVNNGNWHS
ncbi:MAG TPA: HD domain-containing protein [Candidatus Saccharimonadales bacterium]|nr:HD domain-containing protein [Candidatus Saccharimonadales bacterium]